MKLSQDPSSINRSDGRGQQTRRNYFISLRQYLITIHETVRASMKRAHDTYSKQYNRVVNDFAAEVLDHVLTINRVHLEGKAPKSSVAYRGPCTVHER